ncbi:MAG: hypothetical protein IM549_02435 [Pseudanabaena sp. M53BS1SP1A06MG]|nr:hypothetical protein [Pseudanabaena sp. M53BS1SP1A06MG]
MQLDIFSITPNSSSGELPRAIAPVDLKVEEAVKGLLELKQIVVAQFQVGTRIISGDLHGEVTSIIDEILCMVLFDGETKPRQVFTDSLELESSKPELVEGCTVRSRTAFKGKIAKLLRFEEVCNVKFAVVEVDMYGSTIEYSCNIKNLEVVE